MFKRLLKLVLYFIFLALIATPATNRVYALPDGLQETTVVKDLHSPVGMTIAPDGRIFVLQKEGEIKVIKDGKLLPQTFLTVDESNNGERGVLGIALDPSFATNGYFYVYYVNETPLEIRVSRFTANGDTASRASEVVLLRSTQPLGLIHMAGTVRVGPDGKLWISVGDNSKSTNAQDLSNIHGKILRINRDGSIPSDNPFVGRSGAKAEIWAYGLRNPFRFNFLPDGRPIVGDVGESTTEEVNVIQKGGNYGWPNAEGLCSGCSYINPVYSYNHNGQSSSVTGGLVYKSQTTLAFPTVFQGSYFYGDYARGFVRRLILDSKGNVTGDADFLTNAGTVVDFAQGTDGSLYYLTIHVPPNYYTSGALHKVSIKRDNAAPTAKTSASPQSGKAPLTISFSSEGSVDPEGTTLSYAWNFGDGTSSTEKNPKHTYTKTGTFTATLTVNDGDKQGSDAVTITVGNQTPTAVIKEPQEGFLFTAGQEIAFSGDATDPQDGALTASKFSWSILFHHGTHIHPFKGPINGVKSGTFVIPDTGEPATDISYEIQLTVTDSGGLTDKTTRFIKPKLTELSFASKPKEASFTLNGIPHTTPFTTGSVVGYKWSVNTTSPQKVKNKSYDFRSWSDGGAKSHSINAPATKTTYTLNFNEAGKGAGDIRIRVRELGEDNRPTGKFLNGITVKLTDTTGEDLFATTASKATGDEDGWAVFDNISTGTYGVMAFQDDYVGLWKQTDCSGAGTLENATMQNSTSENMVAAFQNNVVVEKNQVTTCKDLGLMQIVEDGSLAFRIFATKKTEQGYSPTGGLNGATVKLTNTAGTTVIKTAVSKQAEGSEDGWVFFGNIPAGTYGLVAYKEGFTGVWKQVDCSLTRQPGTLKNNLTEGHTAAFNNSVRVKSGITSFCYDLGLTDQSVTTTGSVFLRIREFDGGNIATGRFVNDATVKLTDSTGTTVIATTTSKRINDQDGWAQFKDAPTGSYGVVAYKDGLQGVWKQTACSGAGTTENATIQNSATENMVAGYQNEVAVVDSQITWCKDMGLKDTAIVATKGKILFRVRTFSADGTSTSFLNDATAVLTDSTGTNAIQRATSRSVDNQDGWVELGNVPQGTYDILVYKQGYTGVWKQTNCNGAGTTEDVTVQNTLTEGNTAVRQIDVQVTAGEITWCKNTGLRPN